MFCIKYTDRALKHLVQLPSTWQQKIKKVIFALKENPFIGKKLQGELKGCFSLRVWPYRIIYLVRETEITIIILDIGHRQNIYK